MTLANLSRRPSIEQLRATVAYDENRDELIWLVTSRRAISGNVAGRIDESTGYRRVGILGHAGLLVHHVVWALTYGVWPMQLDHEDGDKTNCRPRNLRVSSQSQNMANRGAQPKTVTGVKGVSYHKVTGKWQAQIGVKGKNYYLGTFDTIDEAKAAYDAAALIHFGEFARSN